MILLTGAAGYIASHTWLALWAAGFDVIGVDDFSNSSPEVLNRLQRFVRLWRFYLAYCEAGFRSGRTDVIQLALTRS